MDAKGFIKTVKTLNSNLTIPIHNSGWSHFKKSIAGIVKKLANENDRVKRKVTILKSGERINLDELLKRYDFKKSNESVY